MAARRFLVAVCMAFALSSLGASVFGQTAPEPPAAKPQTVPVRAYNEKGQLTGSGWAIPLHDAYVTVRSILANAHRVELVFSDEMRGAVEAVGGEDIEGNLIVVSVDAPLSGAASAPTDAVAPQFAVSSGNSLPTGGADSGSPDVTIACGTKMYPLRERRVRDIPVFGVAFVGNTRHRDPILGCPALSPDGGVQAIVVWENPIGHPSAVLVPVARATKLRSETRTPWEEWRRASQQPDLRLRNSLLAEALADIWREHYDLAQESLRFLLEKNPTDARGWYYRGYSRAMSGKRKLAIMDYENAVHFEPGNAEARFSLGFSYALVHRLPEAKEQLAALETLDEVLAERLRTLLDAVTEADHGAPTGVESPTEAAPAAEAPPQ